MTPREKLLNSFHSVAVGTLRLGDVPAAVFAEHIANANVSLHVVGQLCTGPNALKSETLAVMLERWFRTLTEYEQPKRVLDAKPGKSDAAPDLDTASSLLLHARVFEVCTSQRRLTESQAREVANHVRQAAPAFFSLEQRCRAPDRHTQRILCATLRAALGQPLQYAQEAASIYLGTSEA
jgi:hypothetical protein